MNNTLIHLPNGKTREADFLREDTMSNSGFFLGNTDGFYVGDINTLHMDILNGNETSYILEGKIGRTGEWQKIQDDNLEDRHFKNIDITSYEYIRLRLYDVVHDVKVRLLGSSNNPVLTELKVKEEQSVLERNIEIVCILEDIRDELKKNNVYMSEILGDEI